MPFENRVLVTALEERQVRTTQARERGLKKDLAGTVRIARRQFGFGNIDQLHLTRGGHMSGKHVGNSW